MEDACFANVETPQLPQEAKFQISSVCLFQPDVNPDFGPLLPFQGFLINQLHNCNQYMRYLDNPYSTSFNRADICFTLPRIRQTVYLPFVVSGCPLVKIIQNRPSYRWDDQRLQKSFQQIQNQNNIALPQICKGKQLECHH